MSNSPVLVTGASGHLGRRVVELLLEKNQQPIIATTRSPESLLDLARRGVQVRRADFEDPASLSAAFAGAERLLLISTDALDRPGRRLAQQLAAVRAAEGAGVKHVVYTSLPNAPTSSVSISPDHFRTEEALAASHLGYTVLRNNLYSDLLPGSLLPAIASGQLFTARASGKVAYVTREDCAVAAAAALVLPEGGRQTLDVTGPAALSGDELAALTSEIIGRPVVHTSVAPEILIEGLVAHGVPQPYAELFASFDTAIARGELATVNGEVSRLLGRSPQSVRDYLLANRSALSRGVTAAG